MSVARAPHKGMKAIVAGLRTVTRMRLILVLCLILCPLSMLLAMESLNKTEIANMLAGWIALGFIVLAPLSHWFSHLLALGTVRELNVLCDEMKSGNLTPFVSLPPEPTDKDPLQTLRHNLFWIGHIIDSRQKALNGAMKNLNTAQAQLVESIEYASLIQNAFLPEQRMLAELFPDYFLLWDQRDAVGGDAYWMKRTDDGFFVATVDCTGHGVPGAFMTLIVHSLFERMDVTDLHDNPAALIAAMNRGIKHALAQDRDNPLSDDGMDCTVLYANTRTGTVHFAGARSSLFIIHSDGSVDELRGDRRGAGYTRTPDDFIFTNHEVPMEPGTRFYLLTDGLIDQIGGELGLPFGKKRFRDFIIEHRHVPLAAQKDLLRTTLRDYMGREARRDDMTVLGCTMPIR